MHSDGLARMMESEKGDARLKAGGSTKDIAGVSAEARMFLDMLEAKISSVS